MIGQNMTARDIIKENDTQPFSILSRLVKITAAGFILSVTTQCKSEQRSKNIETSSLLAKMQCTSANRSDVSGLLEYTLTRPRRGEPLVRSTDCRLAEQLIDRPSDSILVSIGDASPRFFEGVSECDEASVGASAGNGRRARLSEELKKSSFGAQISSTLFALSAPKCFGGIFSSYRPDQNSVLQSVAMRWYHEDAGSQVAEADLPTVIAPVATLHRDGKLLSIVCAKIVYGDENEGKSLDPFLIYRSCLNNFEILLPLENVNG